MWLRVLGSAAGGGFPQWNCDCPRCRAARDGSRPCRARTQSSVAVSADRRRWFVLNASPDIRHQIEAFPALHPRQGRESPIEAVLLTDAELDHTLGLLLLREGRGIRLHATEATRRALYAGSGILRTLERYCAVEWRPVVVDAEEALGDGLSYRAFDVPTTKASRFGTGGGTGTVVGYRLTDQRTGRSAVYAPGVQRLTPEVLARLAGCSCLLVDGTCWSDDEMIALGLAGKTARAMGHVPIDGPDGSLRQLASIPAERKFYVHVNNTNPILLDDSPERLLAGKSGVQVAEDGLEIEI
ncbi:pyrroloquinoline quinone biosynthesis protein B [Amycolatopsis bartoniae]|uniref:Coenzyme PQQ synthesis protein B n=1 Tax=Amycolatopsis bartoniae TaxID=941986 RepID=A0A8H9J0K6_9PSEU|nr:pyrroloquinoline quinone biosynthesis protein PqqB [Amycolatopsis bartoniae]MBB2938643.1 pyrroloquinoline quinone biosynthesis protein B [Amycolatopsis bartoniae]TVT08862.1 pyrroloquinoline quinone biosynthesis protein PqqB [Amycolatopsis bartoniae]GHF69521.1 coenzyme PQQ synthesis protein B [Amycolatopsis bartoniae]